MLPQCHWVGKGEVIDGRSGHGRTQWAKDSAHKTMKDHAFKTAKTRQLLVMLIPQTACYNQTVPKERTWAEVSHQARK